MNDSATNRPRIAIIGGGPAGLMAAEAAAGEGASVDLFEQKASVARKFLIAGKGGLNLTHSVPRPTFDSHYFEAAPIVSKWLDEFSPDDVRVWAKGLGFDTVVGSSGRVFPADLKAAPLLRAWVRRLRAQGVRFHLGHRWVDGFGDTLHIIHDNQTHTHPCDAVVFALGGGSWSVLGSDGTWVPSFEHAGWSVSPLQASNVGFETDFSAMFRQQFAGQAFKSAVLTLHRPDQPPTSQKGEFVVSEYGVEGSLIYAFSKAIRETIEHHGQARLSIDLRPDWSQAQIQTALQRQSAKRSWSEKLKRGVNLSSIQLGLLMEHRHLLQTLTIDTMAALVKSVPFHCLRARPLDEAISSAGGLRMEQLTQNLMSTMRPGSFFAGEMLDWEAPTGGFLLTASMASGRCAGRAAAQWARVRHAGEDASPARTTPKP